MTVEKSRGYFCIAQGDLYVRAAYALALSLKISQSKVNKLSIGVTPDFIVPEHMVSAFDKIVEIPWHDLSEGETWKLKNEWKAIFMTPYEETVKLDADMLFLNDVSDWWDVMSKQDIVIATDVMTYRNEKVTSDFYRKLFTINELPNVYSAFFYFKKVHASYEFFKLAEMIFAFWTEFSEQFLDAKLRPEQPTTDVVFALATEILDFENVNGTTNCIPTFVHMKSQIQNWKDGNISEDWTKNVTNLFAEDCSLSVGNFKQSLPFHYQQKEFLTDEIINFLETKAQNVKQNN